MKPVLARVKIVHNTVGMVWRKCTIMMDLFRIENSISNIYDPFQMLTKLNLVRKISN